MVLQRREAPLTDFSLPWCMRAAAGLAQTSSANLEVMSKMEQAARQCKQVPKWELRYITNRGM